MGLGGVYHMHVGIFDLEYVKVIGVIWCTFSKIGPKLKNGSSYRETDENLGLGGVCNMHVGIFDLEHVKVIWGHLVHFSEN